MTGIFPSEYYDWADIFVSEGIDVLYARSVLDLTDVHSERSTDIAILDVRLIGLSSLGKCLELCAASRLPSLSLLEVKDIIEFSTISKDGDFVILPVDDNEVLVRVRRLVNPLSAEDHEDVIRVRDLVINPSTYEVTLHGKRINLRFKEYELLRLLATNPGRVYTREALLSSIWGYDYFGGTRTVDVHVRRLRSKIELAETPYIETVWNVGYRFRGVINED